MKRPFARLALSSWWTVRDPQTYLTNDKVRSWVTRRFQASTSSQVFEFWHPESKPKNHEQQRHGV